MNRQKYEEIFRATMQAAEDGARINSRNSSELATAFLLISRGGGMKIVGWEGDVHPRDAMETIHEMMEQYGVVGMVFVAETNLAIRQGDVLGIPAVGIRDGVLIYGYLAGDRNNAPYTSAKTFLRNENGELLPTPMDIPPIVTDWVKEALADV